MSAPNRSPSAGMRGDQRFHAAPDDGIAHEGSRIVETDQVEIGELLDAIASSARHPRSVRTPRDSPVARALSSTTRSMVSKLSRNWYVSGTAARSKLNIVELGDLGACGIEYRNLHRQQEQRDRDAGQAASRRRRCCSRFEAGDREAGDPGNGARRREHRPARFKQPFGGARTSGQSPLPLPCRRPCWRRGDRRA